MKLTLENTTKTVMLIHRGQEMPARVWEGTTAGGLRVHAYITRIACALDADASELERELLEQPRAVSEDLARAIPARLIIG